MADEPTGNSKRSANLRPFQPGQSGNPAGRPRGIAATVHKLVGKDASKLVDALIAIAFGKGKDQDRLKAIEMLLDRGWGKALQSHEVVGPDGGPVQVMPVRLLERFSEAEVG